MLGVQAHHIGRQVVAESFIYHQAQPLRLGLVERPRGFDKRARRLRVNHLVLAAADHQQRSREQAAGMKIGSYSLSSASVSGQSELVWPRHKPLGCQVSNHCW